MKVALYARVSTDRQAEKNLSLPAQLRLMREYARQQGWVIIEEFVEPGFSATNANRPALQALLQRIREGSLVIDAILSHKINRMSRNWEDYAPIRRSLREAGVRLVYVVERVDDTPAGRLVEGMLVSVAEFESANLSAETKKGMRQRVLDGGWPHRPPRGYVMVRQSGDKTSHCEIHPREGPLVASAFELFGGGRVSAQTVATQLATDGLLSARGGKLAHGYVRKMLTNPFYIGRIVWQDLQVQGRHAPLISTELFERVQAIIRERFVRPLRHRTDVGFPLKGIAVCGRCRGHMTAERHGRFGYYRCCRKANDSTKCDARYCRADRAHADVLRVLKTLQVTRETARTIERHAEDRLNRRGTTAEAQRHELDQQQAKLQSAAMKLTELFLGGNLSPSAYQQEAYDVKSAQHRLERRLHAAPVSSEAVRARVKSILDLSTSMYDLYQQFDEARRVTLIQTVFTQVVLGADGMFGFVLKAPFAELQSTRSNSKRADAILNAAA